MSNVTVTDIHQALRDASSTLDAADRTSNTLAGILRGRLRHVSSYNLKVLKRELSQFNAQTGRWKS